ncbi:type II secretion system protein J [Peribacillus asahii]|uniref:PulJ/GspJ family protein n=1 Tax=Peribacillus asahii TaxID=228899 RepID=UPI003807D45D
MRKKYISQQSGVTLIELLAALTISALLIGIVYGIFTYSVQSNNKTQSHINLRQEANLIITEMRKRHQEATANYEICYDELLANELPSKQGLSLEKVSVDDVIIDATHCKQEIDPSKALSVKFTLTDQQNRNQFTIDTVIEGRRNSGSVAVEIEKPDKQSFADYLRATGIFLDVNTLEIKGGPTIKGEQGTVVVRENFNPNSSNNIEIQAKDIYIQGNVNRSKNSFELGNSNNPVSNIYIDGNVSIDKDKDAPPIRGYLQYTGNLDLKENPINSVISHSAKRVDKIVSPSFGNLPQFKDPIQNVGKIIIASYATGTFSVDRKMEGIIFYPNGTVDFKGGNNTFRGIVIADKVYLNGGDTLIFQPLTEDEELPF